MGERVKTGNVLIDAWFDAFAPLQPESIAATLGSWEGMFLGMMPAPAGVESVSGADGVARFAELWSDAKSVGDPLGEALERSFGVLGDVGGTFVEVPAVLAEIAKTSSALLAAREAYRAIMLATWQRAFEEIAREATRRTSEGNPPVTPAQWLALSNEVADRVFVAAFHRDVYLAAQRRLSRALADERRSEMKLVDLFAQFGGVPTRRALDDVSKEVNELQRRVRRLERASRVAASSDRSVSGVRE